MQTTSDRRWRHISVEIDALLDMFRGLCFLKGDLIPKDATFQSCWIDHERAKIHFVVRSEEFDDVPVSDDVPEIDGLAIGNNDEWMFNAGREIWKECVLGLAEENVVRQITDEYRNAEIIRGCHERRGA